MKPKALRLYYKQFCVDTTFQSHHCILWWVSFLHFLVTVVIFNFESQFLYLEWEGGWFFLPSLLLQWIEFQVNLVMQISFSTRPNSPFCVQFAILCLFSGHRNFRIDALDLMD